MGNKAAADREEWRGAAAVLCFPPCARMLDSTRPSTPAKMNRAASPQPSRDQTHVRVFFDPIPHLSPLGHTAPDPQMQIYVLTYEKSYGNL